MKTCCFTGPRAKKLFGYNHDAYLPIVKAMQTKIEELYQAGYRTFITGGAQGVDQLAFWAVRNVKKAHPDIKNVVYVPFAGQEQRWAKTGLFSQKEYALMLSVADEVKTVTPAVNTGNMREVMAAMNQRNHAMVEASDLVFCVFQDDTWTNPSTKGGTAECMRYVSKTGKPMIQMSPYTLEFIA